MTRIVILGAGTAGTIMANRLRRLYARDIRSARTTITVVDQDERHVYQPGLLFLPFGGYEAEDLIRPQRAQLHRDVALVRETIDRVVPARLSITERRHRASEIERGRRGVPARGDRFSRRAGALV